MKKSETYKDSKGYEIYYNEYSEAWVLKWVNGIKCSVIGRYKTFASAKKALKELKG